MGANSNKGNFFIINSYDCGYGSLYFFVTTLTRATPVIFAAVAASIAWGSGYSSMGAAGQMVLGGLAAGIVAVTMPGPGWLVLIVSILVAMLVGMIYSFITAYITQRFEVSLLIVTLMSNYIAENIASYLTMYVYSDPLGFRSRCFRNSNTINYKRFSTKDF